MGICARIEAAKIHSQRVAWAPFRDWIITGNVTWFRTPPRMTFAEKNSSQVPCRQKMASVPMAGRASGSITLKKVVMCPPPSILTASSSSLGSAAMWPRRKNVFPQIPAPT